MKGNVEVVDSYFTKTENSKIYMYRGSLQYFHWKKDTHGSLGIICPHLNVGKLYETISVQYNNMGYSE